MFKYLVSDVDGVLTDGGFYYSERGKLFKKFGPHDSDGFTMLKDNGVKPVAITADKRGFPISKKRLDDMGVECFLVPAAIRFEWLSEKFDVDETIFVGDGYFDIECIKNASFGVAPQNAPSIVKQAADLVTEAHGGNGVILEIALKVMKND
jgi:3-deoxy-D-manno-octulosonate 8-phosphate phosphatase (KDO 8-P phosphatase)